ncbi:MAG: SIMPL domain-containing protein [Rhodospirillales bacterium]|nr:SIMPL domain-containing protein [Rhodospirillales bacterium]
MRSLVTLLAAIILALGLAIGGWFIGRGFLDSRLADRVVTVKGVAERDVTADLALWPLRFVVTANQLADAQQRIDADAQKVLAFLAANGIPTAAAEVQNLQVSDLLAQPYRSGPVDSRFIVAQTIMVRTGDVDRVAQASQKIGDLVSDGVVLSSEGQPSSGPLYLFTKLNDIKPAMIAEATRNARQGADQFAQDSGGRVSGIRRASQGLFQILPRDNVPGAGESAQIAKTVRVVSTIDFALID